VTFVQNLSRMPGSTLISSVDDIFVSFQIFGFRVKSDTADTMSDNGKIVKKSVFHRVVEATGLSILSFIVFYYLMKIFSSSIGSLSSIFCVYKLRHGQNEVFAGTHSKKRF
jgi:hypothetical protein